MAMASNGQRTAHSAQPVQPAASSSVLENQGAQHGYASDADRDRIRHDFVEMFNPSSPAWRTQVIATSRQLLTQVMARLPQLEP